MAQAILSRQLAGRSIPVEVGSAGLLPGGRPLPAETRDALIGRGIDPAAVDVFRSRELTRESIETTDLVVGLAREHVREVVVRVPPAWERTFTLKELVRRGEDAGPRGAAEPLPTWLARAAEGRQRSDLLGSSIGDDVVDPIGGSPSDFDRTAAEIERLCTSLAALLWPLGDNNAGRSSASRH
jgi:protein-tyrosine phosphatase